MAIATTEPDLTEDHGLHHCKQPETGGMGLAKIKGMA